MFPTMLALAALGGGISQTIVSYFEPGVYDYEDPGATQYCYGPLTEYDGTLDYAGPSGITHGPFSYSNQQTHRIADIPTNHIGAFVGPGEIQIRGLVRESTVWPLYLEDDACPQNQGLPPFWIGTFGQATASLTFRYWYNNSTQYIDVVPTWETGNVLVTNLNGMFPHGTWAVLPQFNPALGTLNRITVRASSITYDAMLGRENSSADPVPGGYSEQLYRIRVWIHIFYYPQ